MHVDITIRWLKYENHVRDIDTLWCNKQQMTTLDPAT
jgi:hypothetical protein